MKDIELINKLRTLETYQLVTIIETDYYRQMMSCSKEQANDTISNIIDEILIVEAAAAKIERYDLAIICRDKRVELGDVIALNLI